MIASMTPSSTDWKERQKHTDRHKDIHRCDIKHRTDKNKDKERIQWRHKRHLRASWDLIIISKLYVHTFFSSALAPAHYTTWSFSNLAKLTVADKKTMASPKMASEPQFGFWLLILLAITIPSGIFVICNKELTDARMFVFTHQECSRGIFNCCFGLTGNLSLFTCLIFNLKSRLSKQGTCAWYTCA